MPTDQPERICIIIEREGYVWLEPGKYYQPRIDLYDSSRKRIVSALSKWVYLRYINVRRGYPEGPLYEFEYFSRDAEDHLVGGRKVYLTKNQVVYLVQKEVKLN